MHPRHPRLCQESRNGSATEAGHCLLAAGGATAGLETRLQLLRRQPPGLALVAGRLCPGFAMAWPEAMPRDPAVRSMGLAALGSCPPPQAPCRADASVPRFLRQRGHGAHLLRPSPAIHFFFVVRPVILYWAAACRCRACPRSRVLDERAPWSRFPLRSSAFGVCQLRKTAWTAWMALRPTPR